MAVRTEADCLLATGVLYRERLGLRPRDRGDAPLIFVGFKDAAFSIYDGDEPIYHFDLEGRWRRAFINGVHYLKANDGSTQSMDRVRRDGQMILERGKLAFAAARDLDERIRNVAVELLARLSAEAFEFEPPPQPEQTLDLERLRAILDVVSCYDAARWFAHVERQRAAYGPPPFVPPDCRHALVLEATLDGTRAQTNPDGSRIVRDPSEFERHALDVQRLHGRALAEFRRGFLAGTDALLAAPELVTAWIATIRRQFGFDEIQTMLVPDDRAGALPTPSRLAGYRALGLRRITLGVESGDPAIRSRRGLAWDNDAVARWTHEVREAGIGLSAVVLVGAGGADREREHLEATVGFLSACAFGSGDVVALLDADSFRLDDASASGRDPSSTSLDAAARDRRTAAFRAALNAALKPAGVKVVPYMIEKQAF